MGLAFALCTLTALCPKVFLMLAGLQKFGKEERRWAQHGSAGGERQRVPPSREDGLGSCQRGTGAAAVLLYRGSGSVFD